MSGDPDGVRLVDETNLLQFVVGNDLCEAVLIDLHGSIPIGCSCLTGGTQV
jgi:hypothetical protein